MFGNFVRLGRGEDNGTNNNNNNNNNKYYGHFLRHKLADSDSSRGNSRAGPSRDGAGGYLKEKDKEVPQFEVNKGKLELRDSGNPFGQNHRNTLDGIPSFLRE